MSSTVDPWPEQRVAAVPVPGSKPVDPDTAAERIEAQLIMASHLNSFLHHGRGLRDG